MNISRLSIYIANEYIISYKDMIIYRLSNIGSGSPRTRYGSNGNTSWEKYQWRQKVTSKASNIDKISLKQFGFFDASLFHHTTTPPHQQHSRHDYHIMIITITIITIIIILNIFHSARERLLGLDKDRNSDFHGQSVNESRVSVSKISLTDEICEMN